MSSSLSAISPGPAQRAMPGSLYSDFTQSDNHCMLQSQYRGLAPIALENRSAHTHTCAVWTYYFLRERKVMLRENPYRSVNKNNLEENGGSGIPHLPELCAVEI